MRVRNNKSKSTMSKSEEHEAGKRSAIGAKIARMRLKNNRNKMKSNRNRNIMSIKSESEKQQE